MPNGIVDPSSSRFNSLIDRLGGSSCKWVVSVLLFLIINKPKNKHDFSKDYAPRAWILDSQIREKHHQTSKVWAFWAMYVGCPDKIHLC